MTIQTPIVPVLMAPIVAQESNRIRMEMPEGLTVAEIIDIVIPAVGEKTRELVRVTLVSPDGSKMARVPRASWHRVRPHAGTQVIVRIIPGKNFLRSVLSIFIGIAAIALGVLWAPALAGAIGISTGLAAAVIGLGVTVLGNMLLNALVPPPSVDSPGKSDSKKGRSTYALNGWRNEARPDGVIPFVFGTHRYAPPYAAPPYSEIVGDLVFVRAIFNCGYGPQILEDMRIGETAISEYTNVQIEPRNGWSNDTPISLYPRQVVEENINVELTRPLFRNAAGDPTGGSKDTPVKRATGLDAWQVSAIFSFPGGLIRFDDNGKPQTISVQIRVRQRPAGTSDWQMVNTFTFSNKKAEGFFRQVTWTLPSRGRWEIEFDRLTDEHISSQIQSRSVLAALQTIRPEYPINMNQSLALVGVRAQGSYQLQGTLDSFNLKQSSFFFDYDVATNTWIQRQSRNPASHFRYALQSGAFARPVAGAGIDLPNLVDFHNHCRIHGLKYDRVIDTEMTLDEVLKEIAAAGRARPRHDGVRWGVVIDRPQDLVVDHISSRNSYNFKATRIYSRKPHAFRVPFIDQTKDHQPSERIVRWPGYTGSITLTEQLEMPGKTDPDEIWIEARRRMYEAIYRPDIYTLTQDGPIRVATRGDLVMGSFDVLSSTQRAARVKAIEGEIIQLDDEVEMVAGESYGLRWRTFPTPGDTIGISVLHRVVTVAGRTDVLLLADTDERPALDDIVHFGLMASESLPLIVGGVEAGEDFSSHYKLIDASPIIDQLTDAEVAPPWNGRVGGEIDPPTTPPAVPVWVSIDTGFTGTGSSNGLIVTLAPGTSSATETQLIQIEHRLVGASVWSILPIDAAAGGTPISGYVRGDAVELRAKAIAAGNISSGYTTTASVVIGAEDGDIPGAAITNVNVTALLGATSIAFQTTDDASIAAVQIARATTTNFMDAAPVAAAIPVERSRPYTFTDGDATRATIIAVGDFSTAGTWAYGNNWSLSSGKAVHATGLPGNLAQTIASLASGKAYRMFYTVSSRIAGTVRPVLSDSAGGNLVNGIAAADNGNFSDRIVAGATSAQIRFSASSDFAGAIDDVVVFAETSTCLPAGTHYYWLSPLNSIGVPGTAVGPFAVTIR